SWNDAENITYRVVPTLAQRQDGQGGRSKNPARKEWNTGEQSPRSVRTRRQPVPHPARAHSLSGQEIGCHHVASRTTRYPYRPVS
ncbi:hypothetical protein, partial [Klebsiella pneumoniae]|uniref:hypothetical protein n=1 Tax=Klebsiella pneumoniae TaxID=573 RepID=UPI001C608CBB